MSLVKAIAFDWGGVFTHHTFDSSAVVELANLAGLNPAALEPIYLRLMADFEVGAYHMPGFHARFTEATDSVTELSDFRRAFLGAVKDRPVMYQLLASLPRRFKVGMLSNNAPELCDQVRSDPRLARIDEFVFSNEIGVRKPNPEAFAALTAALKVPPAQTVFVDDNEANIAAAKKLGYLGLLLDDEAAFASRWRKLLPDLALPAGFGTSSR